MPDRAPVCNRREKSANPDRTVHTGSRFDKVMESLARPPGGHWCPTRVLTTARAAWGDEKLVSRRCGVHRGFVARFSRRAPRPLSPPLRGGPLPFPPFTLVGNGSLGRAVFRSRSKNARLPSPAPVQSTLTFHQPTRGSLPFPADPAAPRVGRRPPAGGYQPHIRRPKTLMHFTVTTQREDGDTSRRTGRRLRRRLDGPRAPGAAQRRNDGAPR